MCIRIPNLTAAQSVSLGAGVSAGRGSFPSRWHMLLLAAASGVELSRLAFGFFYAGGPIGHQEGGIGPEQPELEHSQPAACGSEQRRRERAVNWGKRAGGRTNGPRRDDKMERRQREGTLLARARLSRNSGRGKVHPSDSLFSDIFCMGFPRTPLSPQPI